MIELTVKPDNGEPFKVNAETRDILVWEKTGRDRSFAKLFAELHIADMYTIAHIASKRLGLYDGTLAEFEKTVDIADFDEEATEPDPTNPAP